MQVRNYSSNRGDSDEQSSSHSKGSKTPAARVASAFGFQSLSGLFEQPAGGRYSSPREAQPIGNTHPSAASQDGEGGADQFLPARHEDNHTSETSAPERIDSASLARSALSAVEADSQTELRSGQAESHHAHTSAEIEAAFRDKFEAASLAQTTSTAKRNPKEVPSTAIPRRLRSRKFDLAKRAATATSIPWKRANPFDGTANLETPRDQAFRRVTPPNAVTPVAERPWGLSREDSASVDSILDPDARSAGKETLISKPEDAHAMNVNHGAATPSKSLPAKSASSDLEVAAATRKSHFRTGLTHLTSTGEAHMVDIGAKMESKRVAIATSYIRFSNPEPSRLISEDSNKKGDALGVARIAGIMAAKRTSDLIPLCHPIAISKVEIDMKTFGPWSRKSGAALWPPSNHHGVVVVQARVDCRGPTGVEMEALTAASTATLTIYDMCKAVDKGIVIGATQVVYKSGGKSGLYVEPRWAEQMGREWFEDRSLEIPATTAPSPEAARQRNLRDDADDKATSASTIEPTDHTVAHHTTSRSPQSAGEKRLVRANYGKSSSAREGRRIALARRLRTLGR